MTAQVRPKQYLIGTHRGSCEPRQTRKMTSLIAGQGRAASVVGLDEIAEMCENHGGKVRHEEDEEAATVVAR